MKPGTIHIKNLAIGYKSKNHTKVVAKEIHSTIRSGELTCLLGANGVGKSTLLRTLSSFQPKLAGEIYILEREINTYSDKELSTIIGVVLTEKSDIRNMTVTEIVSMGRSPYTGFWGRLTDTDERVVRESIALVKIDDLASRRVESLSDGERQKVMIAKALAQETPIIYMDEPTAFLDFPSKVEIMQLLHHLTRKTNKTIFLSTHDLELALQIADKIWLMDKKNGITVGTPEDLSLNNSLHAFFQHKGISFDKNTGLFRIENSYSIQIQLKGEGVQYSMVKKALQRNGIFADRQIESNVCIDAGDSNHQDNMVIYNKEGKKIKVQSIEELLEQVRNIF